MLTKKLTFDNDVLDVVSNMDWNRKDGRFAGVITRQLERRLYLKVNKALEAMGGKWNRKAQAHLFPTDPRPQVEGLLDNGELTVARDGYFVTPPEIREKMARLARIEPGMRVLEPSAGTGELAMAILETQPRCNLWTGEKDAYRATVLRSKGFNLVHKGTYDFLLFRDGGWDRIVQNPPFEQFQDVDHVRHAYDLLATNGVLVSVMCESAFFRQDRKAREFREWLASLDHEVIDLPEGAFNNSDIGVKTRIVVIRKHCTANAWDDLPLFVSLV